MAAGKGKLSATKNSSSRSKQAQEAAVAWTKASARKASRKAVSCNTGSTSNERANSDANVPLGLPVDNALPSWDSPAFQIIFREERKDFFEVIAEGRSPTSNRDDGHDLYCSSCRNGGDKLILCSQCPRVFCSLCLEQTPNMTDAFVCPNCHYEKDLRTRKCTPYLDESGQAIKCLATPTTREFFMSCDSRPVLIISIALEGMTAADSCPKTAYYHLHSHLFGDVAYVGLDFNLTTPNGRESLIKRLDLIVNSCESADLQRFRRFAIFITDHSTPDGFLHIGPNNGGSACLSKVLDAIFIQSLRQLIQRADESVVFLMSCGAVVTVDKSYQQLKEFYNGLDVGQMVVFGQKDFQLAFANYFISDFCQNLFIFRKPNVESILRSHQTLGAHTDLFVFRKRPEALSKNQYFKYTWAHEGSRPYGHISPIQCICSAIRSSEGPQRFKADIKSNSPIIQTCKNPKCQLESTYEFPKNSIFVKKAIAYGDDRGGWIRQDLSLNEK